MLPLLTSPQFPDPAAALDEPNGLLAVSHTLDVNWLLPAYSRGIFPWYDEDDGPVLWWSPCPRAVVRPNAVKVSRSLRRTLKSDRFTVTMDTAFEQVIDGCRAPRTGQAGTWITDQMRTAYIDLFAQGYAHSVESWSEGVLVGGLYGVSLGSMFFGESMFSRESDASKVALVALARTVSEWGFTLIDCQMINDHLRTLGVEEMSRSEFLGHLSEDDAPTRRGVWSPSGRSIEATAVALTRSAARTPN